VCELYSQLDLDGDGVVTWDEMFEFTIEMGRTTAKVLPQEFPDVRTLSGRARLGREEESCMQT